MFNGRTSSACFTTTILSLLIILMVTMIKDSDGSLGSCNGSNGAKCQQVLVEEEEEFMMDTEEHRGTLAYNALSGGNTACGRNCGGGQYLKSRGCYTYDRCR
ncbi:rapid ALkalinization Factor [Artemisia annua]|uniref:Rapid ALkalinization Factor n=1 Tax=Artemisia annua TaxID=35608 RepID=A0A2U1LPV8_ARTAN|nr:rapid ALkalinization Factor [Artemisia annua]